MGRRPQNATDERAQARARRFAEQERLLDEAALEAVLALPAGRRVLYRVITRAGTFCGSYTGNTETFFNEGRRAVGLELMTEIQAQHPGAWLQMLTQTATERAAIARVLDEPEEK